MAKRIDEDVLNVLRDLEFDGPNAKIVKDLDRALYLRVNKVLEALGGKWTKKVRAHVFPEDAGPLIGDVVATGEYVDAKREFELFETPRWLADKMCSIAGISSGSFVLEPSAGRGAIANAARDSDGAQVWCVELESSSYEKLVQDGFAVTKGDFLQTLPVVVGSQGMMAIRYDAILMNPPFSRGQDMRHVRHAFQFLAPGGVLVAVMSPGFTFRSDRYASEFREWLDEHENKVEPLPDGTFKAAGTMVRTVLVTIYKGVE